MNHPVIVDPDPIHLIAPITPLQQQQQQKQQMLHLLLQLPEPQQGVVLQVTRLLETTTTNILVNHRHRQNQTRVMSLEVAITRGNR